MKKREPDTYRHAYFYICKGGCGKKRATFDYERFLRKICALDESLLPDPNQPTLV